MQQAEIDAIANNDQDADTRINAILEATRQALDMDVAIVSNIVEPIYTVKYYQPEDAGLQIGQRFNFEETYCEITVRWKRTISIPHMKVSEFNRHPCYHLMGLESYIGTPLMVDGEQYGTVNFSSGNPHQPNFTPENKALINHCATLISGILSEKATAI
jgi:GAF domain-containing protein